MWKNIVEPDRPQMTTRRMRITCWIPMATSTHREYAILIAVPLRRKLRERPSILSLLRYTYIACLVLILVASSIGGHHILEVTRY